MYNNNYRFFGIGFFLLLLLFQSEGSSQSGWFQLNSGTNIPLNSVNFVNDYTGYMVGSGIGIKTTNGGFNWMIIPGMSGGTNMKFVDANTGYVANGSIIKTIDGGNSWTTTGVSNVKAIFAVNSNIIYGVGDYSTIVKSTNGGASWVGQSVQNSYFSFKSVYFLDALTGLIVGGKMNAPYNGVVYKTNNGGVNWRAINVPLENSEYRSICFADAVTGYIVGGDVSQSSGAIFKSTSAGEFWTQQGIAANDLNCVYFINVNTGYVVGESGMVLKTVDGSVLWNTELSNTTNDLYSVYFVRPDVGYTAGLNGDIQKTLNGGIQGPPYSIEGIVTYQGSNTPVPSGKVVAINYNYTNASITRVDSALITNGVYQMTHIPGGDSTDIMAYPDDEVAADFAPGFYGNSIYWTGSATLYPTGNLIGINISVFQSHNPGGGTKAVSGGVFASTGGLGLALARVYAFNGSDFFGVGTSQNGGPYDVGNLPPGTYTLICDRMGYRNAQRVVTITGNNLDSINFYLTNIGPIGINNQQLYTPSQFSLMQNYPNPFNPTTNIRFDVPKQSNVRLSVFDVLGREVEVLVNENLKPGTYKVDWQAAKYSSGLYFYKLIANDFVDVKKMILVK